MDVLPRLVCARGGDAKRTARRTKKGYGPAASVLLTHVAVESPKLMNVFCRCVRVRIHLQVVVPGRDIHGNKERDSEGRR